MDIVVQIPDAKAQLVLDALNGTPNPGWTPPAANATAAAATDAAAAATTAVEEAKK
jgi:hypothetical protein